LATDRARTACDRRWPSHRVWKGLDKWLFPSWHCQDLTNKSQSYNNTGAVITYISIDSMVRFRTKYEFFYFENRLRRQFCCKCRNRRIVSMPRFKS
jgi:hypothetical protein